MIKRGQLAEFEATSFRPGDLRLEAFHPMSTARMGADPATSVTDPDGAVRGTEGLSSPTPACSPARSGSTR